MGAKALESCWSLWSDRIVPLLHDAGLTLRVDPATADWGSFSPERWTTGSAVRRKRLAEDLLLSRVLEWTPRNVLFSLLGTPDEVEEDDSLFYCWELSRSQWYKEEQKRGRRTDRKIGQSRVRECLELQFDGYEDWVLRSEIVDRTHPKAQQPGGS